MNVSPFLLVVFGYIAVSNGQSSTSVILPDCQHAQCQDADWWCPNPIQTSGCCGRCIMDCRAAFCPIGPPGCVVPPGECCCITANVEKPGTCPRTINSFGHGACPEMCSSDQECPGRQKCCSPGCGRRCMNPIQNVEKPGTCPQLRGRDNFIGICVYACSSDQECGGRQKCCSSGCGTQCMNPAPTAPDCTAVFCAEVPIHCQHSVIPPGQCCRRCLDRPRGYDRRRG